MSGYYSQIQNRKLGLKKVGKGNRISKLSRFISKDIIIGNGCRIDDDTIFKGKVKLGNNVHIARGCSISGGEKGVVIEDFSALSNFVQIFESTDHYSSDFLPSATLKKKERCKYSHIISKSIKIGKAVLVGSFSVILPGSEIEDFSSIGSHTVVYKKIKKGTFFSKETTKLRDYKSMKKRLNILQKKLLY